MILHALTFFFLPLPRTFFVALAFALAMNVRIRLPLRPARGSLRPRSLVLRYASFWLVDILGDKLTR